LVATPLTLFSCWVATLLPAAISGLHALNYFLWCVFAFGNVRFADCADAVPICKSNLQQAKA
jgi:hypothetical protein